MIKCFRRIALAVLWITAITPMISGVTLAQDKWFWATTYVDWVIVPWTEKKRDDSLIHTIKTAINRILWILATIALCLCLYAGFMMLTSWADSKWYDNGLKILKNAAIWLAIIWASRLIVSLIFRIINGSINPNISWEWTNSKTQQTNIK